MNNLPEPPEQKPVNEGINFVVALMMIIFVLVFIIVGANTLVGP
jgi:hypothetical protein